MIRKILAVIFGVSIVFLLSCQERQSIINSSNSFTKEADTSDTLTADTLWKVYCSYKLVSLDCEGTSQSHTYKDNEGTSWTKNVSDNFRFVLNLNHQFLIYKNEQLIKKIDDVISVDDAKGKESISYFSKKQKHFYPYHGSVICFDGSKNAESVIDFLGERSVSISSNDKLLFCVDYSKSDSNPSYRSNWFRLWLGDDFYRGILKNFGHSSNLQRCDTSFCTAKK